MIFIFPGQGSQYVGMGKDLQDNFPGAKLLFEEINDALNYDLSKIMFEDPTSKLNNTQYTQPAIMAVSMAIIKVLEQELGGKISTLAKYVMGHSLGEYSALCAADSFSAAISAKILQIRGNAMQNAVALGTGGMAALLGADLERAEKIISQVNDCEIANDNGGGQIVLSFLMLKLEEIKKLAASMKIRRVILLPVSAPFHSSFMQPAADELAQALEGIHISSPSVKFISNLTAQVVNDPLLIKDYLTKQVTNKVRWGESVIYCGTTQHYVEIGPGKVLTNLVRKIDNSAVTTNIGNVTEIKDFLNSVQD